jgi:uncharacterized membrane protein YqgA involved in biofilm formation
MVGTLINVVTVAAGSLLGMLLKSKIPPGFSRTVFQVMGLFTMFMGIDMALKTDNVLVLVLSLLIGSLIGYALKLEERCESLITRFTIKEGEKSKRFTEGLLSAFMMFCVGSMTVLGCLEEGMSGKRELLVTKSIMDFFSSSVLASAFGKGVFFSVIPLLVYQGLLTMGASFLSPVLNEAMSGAITAAGGIMLLALGINILEIRKLQVLSMLPALLVAPALMYAMQWLA